VAGALVVVFGAASACGSTSVPGSSGPGTTTPSKAADLALARKGLIVLSDLPSGWTASGKVTSGSGSSGGPSLAKIAACLGVSTAELKENWPTENSPTFNSADGNSTVSDEVEAFPTRAQAATDYATFSNPKTPGCITTIFGPVLRQQAQKGGGAGTTIGAVTTTRVSFPAFGDQSGELQISMPFSVSGQTISLYLDLVDILKGRQETILSLTTTGTPLATTVTQQLATAAVRHMS
jgi:hypothetical protein